MSGGHTVGIFEEEPYDFAPGEQAFIPGSPGRPQQPAGRRLLYFIVSLILLLTSGLANALVSVNATYLRGSLGADSQEIAWLPVVYSMTFISMNLLLVRFRQQFGLRLYAMLGLMGLGAIILLHVSVGGLQGAIVVHALAGIANAPLATLGVYYMMTAAPQKYALQSVILALGLTQVPTPLAQSFSSEQFGIDHWRSLYLLELGAALLSLGAVALLRLPPSKKTKVFEPLDFVTYAVFAPGAALLCAFLGMGRVVWWSDRPWLGWALAGSIPLLGAALYIEANRARPLLDLKWLRGHEIVRLVVVVLASRIVLAEPSQAGGLLNLLGVDNDELHLFSALQVGAAILGAITAALIFRPNRIGEMGALALGLVALAAAMDSHATDLSRAPQFYLTQMVVTFSAAVFLGPALLFGVGRVVQAGGSQLASFLVVFVAAQTVGSLCGGALLGTFQTVQEKADSAILVAQAPAFDPVVTGRIHALSQGLGGVLTGPGQQAGGGVALLQQDATREANILAYDSTFTLIAVIAAAASLYLAVMLLIHWRQGARRRAPATPPQAAGSPS